MRKILNKCWKKKVRCYKNKIFNKCLNFGTEQNNCIIYRCIVSDFGTNGELWYVQVESDCQTLVKALQSSELDKAPEGILFREIRVFARQNFNACSFSFAPTACNDLAHTVASFGPTLQVSSELWPDDLPNDVLVCTSNLDQIDQKQRRCGEI
ncbi:hypothetical protein ZWY2020_036360 [Hordeum vulgare]|nr:hypothetical protein ZWY2020_036360 [Hordeum vulgare]